MVTSECNVNDERAVLSSVLFQGCGAALVRRFLDSAGVTVLDFPGGECIPASVRAGRFAVVISGSVKIFSGADSVDDSVLINVVSAGEIFDIAALTGSENTPVSAARTAGKSRVAFIGASGMEEIMREFPCIAMNAFRFLCGRVRFLNQKIHTLSRRTSEQKLADFLLHEFVQEDGVNLVRLKSCVELSDRLGISRASLYRALGLLEESGIISRQGKQIILRDVERLQQM